MGYEHMYTKKGLFYLTKANKALFGRNINKCTRRRVTTRVLNNCLNKGKEYKIDKEARAVPPKPAIPQSGRGLAFEYSLCSVKSLQCQPGHPTHLN